MMELTIKTTLTCLGRFLKTSGRLLEDEQTASKMLSEAMQQADVVFRFSQNWVRWTD